MLDLYNAGLSINKIRKQLGRSWNSVAAEIKSLGLPTNYTIRRGKQVDNEGYVGQRLEGKWVREHRAKAEAVLGRKLKPGEVVHHINGDRADNRNQNLLICTQPYHIWLHWRMAQLYMEEHFLG